MVEVVGGMVEVVGGMVVVVSVLDDELDELGVANPTPVMTVASAKPPSARTRTPSNFTPALRGLRMRTSLSRACQRGQRALGKYGVS
jgi:hypothetical protein